MPNAEQVGVVSYAPLALHNHSSDPQGGQLNPELALNPQPKVDFGDGSDGDIVIAVNTTLTRDMSYHNLTINAGIVLFPNGFKIKVKGKIYTDVGGGIIWTAGGNGSPGAGGVGGAGGTPAIAGRKSYACLPTIGSAGGNGGGAGVAVAAGGAIPDVELLDTKLLYEGRLWAGAGGSGGGGVGNAPTAGAIPTRVLAGAKGGAGALGIHIGANANYGAGGGGGGGGLIEIWAYEIDNSGVIYAWGGNGGSGQEDANNQAGGGGGGGGGAVLIYYQKVSGAGLNVGNIFVNGGTGGGTSNPGLPGDAGFLSTVKVAA